MPDGTPGNGSSIEESGEDAQGLAGSAAGKLGTAAAAASAIGNAPENLAKAAESQQGKADRHDVDYKNKASNGDYGRAEKAHQKARKAQGRADKLGGMAGKAAGSDSVKNAKKAGKALGAASTASSAASKLAGQMANSGDTGDAAAGGAGLAGTAIGGAAKAVGKKAAKAVSKLIPLSVKIIGIAFIVACVLFAAIAATVMQSATVFLTKMIGAVEETVTTAVSNAKNAIAKIWESITEKFTDFGKTVKEIRENPFQYAASLTDSYFEKVGDEIYIHKAMSDMPEEMQVTQSQLDDLADAGDYDAILNYYAGYTQQFLKAAYSQTVDEVEKAAAANAKAVTGYDEYSIDRTLSTMPADPFTSVDYANLLAAYSVTDDLSTASLSRFANYMYGIVVSDEFLSYGMEEVCQDMEAYVATESFYWTDGETGEATLLGTYTVKGEALYEPGDGEQAEAYAEMAGEFADAVKSSVYLSLSQSDDTSGLTAGVASELLPEGTNAQDRTVGQPSHDGLTIESWDFGGVSRAVISGTSLLDGTVTESGSGGEEDCKLWWDNVTITPYSASDALSFLGLDPDATWEGSQMSEDEQAESGYESSQSCTNEEAYVNYYKTLKDELEQIGCACTGSSASGSAYGTVLTESEIEAYLDALPEGTSGNRREIVKVALNAVGRIPYCNSTYNKYPYYGWNSEWGEPSGDSRHPYKGLDCSGFVQWAYRNALSEEGGQPCSDSYAGLGSTGAISTGGGCEQLEAEEDLMPGDLGLLFVGGSSGDSWNHVGIYIGGGKWVHCSGSAGTVTVTDNPGFTVYFRVSDGCLEEDGYAKDGTRPSFMPAYASLGDCDEDELYVIATTLCAEFSDSLEGFRCCAEAVYHSARYNGLSMYGAVTRSGYLSAYTELYVDGTKSTSSFAPSQEQLETVRDVMAGNLAYFPASAYPYPVMYFNTESINGGDWRNADSGWRSSAVVAREVASGNGETVVFFYIPGTTYSGYGS